ncbi:MAG: T9SS type A sorting domain-containing protein [Bacteroidota bacterium]
MRIITLITALFIFPFSECLTQCDIVTGLDLLEVPSATVAATDECTDSDGWTHYYNADENILVISIKKNGQDIGDLNNGLNITSSIRADFGTIGLNLSNADYIANEAWLASNRKWQITGANPIAGPIQVRSYINQTDIDDLATLQQSLGIVFPLALDKLNPFTISEGGALDAHTTSTQPFSATFTFYDMAPGGGSPDWVSGNQNDFFYSEFESQSTDIAGSTGILFFVDNPAVAVSGKITKPNAAPVSDVTISVPGSGAVVSDMAGSFSVADLNINFNYELVPEKDINHLEDVTSVDLIRLIRHLAAVEIFTSPFQYIAADADKTTEIDQADLIEIMNLILGETTVFPNNTSWRFVPQFYNFPDPDNPFMPTFPETISISMLPDSLFNQNFTGIKIGDIGEAGLNPPPMLNTTFILPEVGTCDSGEEIVFALTANDFTGLKGFQFTIEWDKDVMTFMSVDNLNLFGLTPQNIGLSHVADGKITFVWFNPSNAGESIPDGTVICELRFLTTGNVNDTTPLAFTNSITESLIVHQNMAEQVPNFIDGATVIGNNSAIGTDAFIEPADCDGTAIGSIDLTVTGAVPPITYEWNNGEMTEDISMLAPDTYTVTITDSSGGCPKVVSYEIAPGGDFEITADVMPMPCPTAIIGSIDVNIMGGAPPFTYQWSNGEDTEIIDGLYEGMYDVTVTDAVGCTQSASFEIENSNRIVPNVTVMNSMNVGASNGSIIIEDILGGLPPFTFQWSNGATTQSIMDVPPGDYSVTISDEIGCGHVFGYLVHDLMVSVGEINGQPINVGLFPNPMMAGSDYNLVIDSPVNGGIEAVLFNTGGQLVSQVPLHVKKGQNHFPLPAPEVSGLYFIQIIHENEPAGWLKMMVR